MYESQTLRSHNKLSQTSRIYFIKIVTVRRRMKHKNLRRESFYQYNGTVASCENVKSRKNILKCK